MTRPVKARRGRSDEEEARVVIRNSSQSGNSGVDETEIDEAPRRQMLREQRLRVGTARLLQRPMQRAPRKQRGGEMPRAFAEAAHLDAGLRAVHEKPDRP